MGNESSINGLRSRIFWRVALRLSSALDQPERDAALGDLAESGVTGFNALRDVAGLVIRRQTSVFKEWRLWIVAGIILLPLTLALCTVAQDGAHESAVYTWMYANNSDWDIVKTFGFWYVFADAAMRLLVHLLTIAGWSWSAGFLLGGMRTEMQRGSQLLLLPLLVAAELASTPQRFTLLLMKLYGFPQPTLLPDPNAPVTAIVLYQRVLPWIVLSVVVALPVISGMRCRVSTRTLRMRLILVIGATFAVLTLMPRVPGFALLVGHSGMEFLRHNQPVARTLAVLAYWPPLYFVAMKASLRWHHRTVQT